MTSVQETAALGAKLHQQVQASLDQHRERMANDVKRNNAEKFSSLKQTMESVQTIVTGVESTGKETKQRVAAIRAIVGKNELTCNQTKDLVARFGTKLAVLEERVLSTIDDDDDDGNNDDNDGDNNDDNDYGDGDGDIDSDDNDGDNNVHANEVFGNEIENNNEIIDNIFSSSSNNGDDDDDDDRTGKYGEEYNGVLLPISFILQPLMTKTLTIYDLKLGNENTTSFKSMLNLILDRFQFDNIRTIRMMDLHWVSG